MNYFYIMSILKVEYGLHHTFIHYNSLSKIHFVEFIFFMYKEWNVMVH